MNDRSSADRVDDVTGGYESRGDEALFALYAAELVAAVDDSVEGWVRRAVLDRVAGPLPAALMLSLDRAAAEARAGIVSRLRSLLDLDLDQQWTNPLAVLRSAVCYPTAVLIEAGAAPADRDESARRLHPDDQFDLVPAAFGDFSQRVHDAGITWGAAKAHIHLQRRRAETGRPASAAQTGAPIRDGERS